MFKVSDKTTGEVFTVYGLNGTHFLCYNAELDWWFFKNIEECRPVYIRADMEAQRHGRWEMYEINDVIYYRCPFCKTTYAYVKEGHIAPCKCVKCGVDMEGGGEE